MTLEHPKMNDWWNKLPTNNNTDIFVCKHCLEDSNAWCFIQHKRGCVVTKVEMDADIKKEMKRLIAENKLLNKQLEAMYE